MKRMHPIDRTYNKLCRTCFIRIYNAFPHHSAQWEKIHQDPTPKPTQELTQPTLL